MHIAWWLLGNKKLAMWFIPLPDLLGFINLIRSLKITYGLAHQWWNANKHTHTFTHTHTLDLPHRNYCSEAAASPQDCVHLLKFHLKWYFLEQKIWRTSGCWTLLSLLTKVFLFWLQKLHFVLPVASARKLREPAEYIEGSTAVEIWSGRHRVKNAHVSAHGAKFSQTITVLFLFSFSAACVLDLHSTSQIQQIDGSSERLQQWHLRKCLQTNTLLL